MAGCQQTYIILTIEGERLSPKSVLQGKQSMIFFLIYWERSKCSIKSNSYGSH
jgi:hypothetical protein